MSANDIIYKALSGSAGTQIELTVAATPDGARRTSTVEPVGGEGLLRLWSWIEDNRRYVDEKTNGRVAYVYMPNTAEAGFTLFIRMYFAQTDKDALILDERSNGGGQAANYIIDVLSRKWLAGWKDRYAMRPAARFRQISAKCFGSVRPDVRGRRDQAKTKVFGLCGERRCRQQRG